MSGIGQRAEEQLARLYPAVLAQIRSKLSGNPKAEDLAQETMLAAWKAMNKAVSEIEDIKSYVRGIANNKIQQELRDKHRSGREMAMDPETLDRLPQGIRQAIAQERIEESEWHGRLKRALQRLPTSYRKLLDLRYLEGLSNKEAARKLRISPEQASRRKYKAIDKLRDALQLDRPGELGTARGS